MKHIGYVEHPRRALALLWARYLALARAPFHIQPSRSVCKITIYQYHAANQESKEFLYILNSP